MLAFDFVTCVHILFDLRNEYLPIIRFLLDPLVGCLELDLSDIFNVILFEKQVKFDFPFVLIHHFILKLDSLQVFLLKIFHGLFHTGASIKHILILSSSIQFSDIQLWRLVGSIGVFRFKLLLLLIYHLFELTSELWLAQDFIRFAKNTLCLFDRRLLLHKIVLYSIVQLSLLFHLGVV